MSFEIDNAKERADFEKWVLEDDRFKISVRGKRPGLTPEGYISQAKKNVADDGRSVYEHLYEEYKAL